jgi:mono/diheme cytochrome c family protein
MADKKTVGHAYNIDFLNVVFAASSVFLFISVVWMVWDDYDREWKNTQRRFTQLEMEVVDQTRQKVAGAVDQKKLEQLRADRGTAQQTVDEQRQKVDELEDRLADANARLYRVNQDYQFAKATYDVDRYDFEALRAEHPERAASRADDIAQQFARLNELNLEVEKVAAERDAIGRELGQYTGKVAEIDKQIDAMLAEERRLATRLETIQPSLVKTLFRDAPLLDFMAPTLKVQQIITPNIVDDVNFTRVPKMDRCTTCHLAIDREGYEKYPQPFRTHPELNLYLGSASPHPLEQIGCTVCHEGMGQSVSFRDASHTPRDDAQREQWEEEHHWEAPHLWDYPMLPVGMTEASCAKCHKGEVFTPGRPKLNLAYNLYERAGCYACHKTRGFENLRKPGPDLTRIQAKLTPDWVKNWIRNPRAIKASTWMPRVWYNSNSSAPADARRNEVEIDATVAYLFASSGSHRFANPDPPRGDAAAGKTIVEEVGCLGCHVADGTSRVEAGPRRTFGQPLQSIGSKTTYAWLYDWVRDPRHYSPGTVMPDLRLTDAQAADVAAYLATLKGATGDGPKATFDQAASDEVLLDYYRATMPVEDAKAAVSKLTPEARTLELGRRAILRYGCFSCHEIKGFETAQPIGIELSEEGSKLLTQLDFGFIHEVPHTKLSWFRQKIMEPRIFDRGRELRPLEKLRMPNFDLTAEEASLFVTAIMSFQRDVQPAQAMRPRSARADNLIAGRNFVRRRNCVACHEIERDGGDYRTLVADPSLAPPLLTPEGAKVQPDWLYAFLRTPITIRPWLAVRMPTFHLDDRDANQVIRYFAAVSDAIGPFRTHETLQAVSTGAAGAELFQLLRCQQCHVLGEIPKDQPTANLAPDLRMAAERLQPDWILEWLKRPSVIQPGTRMPAFWPEFPKSYYPQLGGSAEAQIRAIRDHLLTFRGGPSPRRPTAAGQQIASPN